MKPIIAAICLATLSACAANHGQQSITHEYRQQDHVNRFEDYTRACNARGGLVVLMRRGSSNRHAKPSSTDAYSCRRGNGHGLGFSF